MTVKLLGFPVCARLQVVMACMALECIAPVWALTIWETGTNGGNGHERVLRFVSGVLLAWLLFEPQRQFLQLQLALLNLQLRADQVEHPGHSCGSLPLDSRRTFARQRQLLLRHHEILLELRVRKPRSELVGRRPPLDELLA